MQIFWLNVPYVLKQNLWGKWHKCTHNWKFYVSIVLFAQLTCWCALMKSSNKRTQLFWVHCWCACVSVVCFSFYLYFYIYEWRYKEYFNRHACKIANTYNVYSACLYSTISRGRRTIVASIHDVPLFSCATRDDIFTSAQKLTYVILIHRTESTTKTWEKKKEN